ncbi:hypothetical protein GCM10009751_10750 [Myceligenerans crystallogenes]|uniref:CBM2 domain-containing protein n=1 Tax=Myceligenerans crystallogenes TaxID=316335 RepID=A0ABP4ZG23_9MICO
MVGALAATLVLTAGALGLSAATQPASSAASLTRVTNFGPNPSNLNMYVYVPENVDPNPALLVAVHYCTGTAQAYFSGAAREFVTAADQQGFVIVFPEATRDSKCFDVYSPDALRRDGGSDPVAIKSMIDYARSHYGVDASRIYATGVSSGAMTTNVLLALYPDVFAAGSAFAGVPATCFATGSSTNTWNSTCSGGRDIRTAQAWGDAARGMYPSWSGTYPRFQTWHGTQDTVLAYPNFGEQIKQWTNLHGLASGSGRVDQPQTAWTRTTYGDAARPTFQSISLQGYSHDVYRTGMARYAMDFFGGLDEAGATPSPSPSMTMPSRTPTPTPSIPDCGTGAVSALTTCPPPSPSASPRPPGCEEGAPTPAPSCPPWPSDSASPSPASGCTAVMRIVNGWQGGYQAEVTVTATRPLTGWTTSFTLSGSTVSQLWNGQLTVTGSRVQVKNSTWNGSLLAAGGTASYGFIGTGTAPATIPVVDCA